MQNDNALTYFDLEFEISGEKFGDFELKENIFSEIKHFEIAKTIHKIIFKNIWEIVSIKKLEYQIIKKLNFIDLIKVKLDFSEKYNGCFTDELFGWIYYNEDEKIKSFRFILDISTGEIKYLK
jgi:hypothetical protein